MKGERGEEGIGGKSGGPVSVTQLSLFTVIVNTVITVTPVLIYPIHYHFWSSRVKREWLDHKDTKDRLYDTSIHPSNSGIS